MGAARRGQASGVSHLAVYGSLRRGLGLPDEPDVRASLFDRGPCTIAGILYDLGEYPGLVPGDGRVVGELYELRDPAVLVELDRYEEYDARDRHGSLFVRRAVRLIEPPLLDAWVYWFNGDVGARAPVPAGDWAAYLRAREAPDAR
jgi:gamma-glutamylcyclotransferase (GGCT)/AIG2-like uncharacterized protein YtfP